MKKRILIDKIQEIFTWIVGTFGLLILLTLLVFIFQNGRKLVTWEFITSDYHPVTINASLEDALEEEFTNPELEGYFVKNLGIVLIDTVDQENKAVVEVTYVDRNSPLHHLTDSTNSTMEIKDGLLIDKMIGTTKEEMRLIILSNAGAETVKDKLEELYKLDTFTARYNGGGIKGSLLSTIYLIVLTLSIATPLGIIVALYLNEFMKKGKPKNILSTLIDLLSGIPSVIYGLFGVVFIVPITMRLTGASGGSLLSGALVLSIMLLPILIKTTEETLKVIAPEVRLASLALGASRVQTIVKVVIPLSIKGILSAVLLAIARIIGESAALIYVVGTVIKDEISIFLGSTSLSVHIWSLMGGESPNLEASSAISIIILVLVLLFSILMKLLLRQRKVKHI